MWPEHGERPQQQIVCQRRRTSPICEASMSSKQTRNLHGNKTDQTATPLKLSEAQRQQIRQYFASKPGQRMQSANFSLTVGAAVPQDVPLQKLPPETLS